MIMGLAISGVSHAACSDLTQPSCRLERLKATDEAINSAYASLLKSLPEPEGLELRTAQRAWIKQRNQACKVDEALSRNEDWIEVLSQDSTRSICVIGASEGRLAELRTARNDRTSDAMLSEIRSTVFPVSHRTGKWYAELEISTGSFPNEKQFEIQTGVFTSSTLVAAQLDRGRLYNHSDSLRVFRIGLAVDLDHGLYNFSENGEWENGTPGGPDGSTFKPGTDSSIMVRSTGPSIARWMSRGSMRINTGDAPFSYPVPAGYRPWFVSADRKDLLARPDWVVPRYQPVEGLSYEQWASAYWSWLLSRDLTRNPVEDLTGAYCGDGQSGPVWMLSGGDAKLHIERTCTIPHGRYLLLPVVANRLSFVDAGTCKEMITKGTPRHGAEAVDKAFVTIDNLKLDTLEDYRLYTAGCTDITDREGKIQSPNSVFFGIYVILNPLPPGEHVLHFGGENLGLNTQRDVTYRLTVQ
jgi:uncharacterized protein YecT (DUF1311 family)